MNSEETTLKFERVFELWQEGADRVNAPGYQPTHYGENDLDAYIVGVNKSYDVVTEKLRGLEIGIQADVYRRAGELNEASKKKILKDGDGKIPDYGKHFLDEYIIFNAKEYNYEKTSSIKNLPIKIQDELEDRIHELNEFKIDIDGLLKYIGTDENKNKTDENKKKKKKKKKKKTDAQNSIEVLVDQDTEELKDKDMEDFKQEIMASQQAIYTKCGYDYVKIKPVFSKDFIKSLEENDKKDEIAK